MSTVDNSLTLVILQTQEDRVLSKVTVEYPTLPNWMANALNIGIVKAITGVAEQFAADKVNT